MNKIGMIADDLTGANDSGVQLVKKGLRSSVIFDLHPLPADQSDIGTIIIDTDSRDKSKNKAYEAVLKASMFLKENGFSHIYKKVDSTLRGNLGVEIEAVTTVFEPDFCIIAPAFPRIGRTTKNGVHYLNGIPLSETEIAKDPKCPVLESSLCALLESQSSEKVGLVRTGELGLDLEIWRSELNDWQEKGVRWLVFDVETDEHLESIASNISQITKNVVWVGSAGLAEYLPEKLDLIHSVPVQPVKLNNENILVVSGSLSSVTRVQISRLLEMNTMIATEVDPLTVFTEDYQWQKFKQSYINKLVSTYQEGNNAVLFVDSSSENRNKTAEIGKRLGLTSSEVSNRISQGLGEIASEFLKKYIFVSGLVLTGGDTAKDVCRQIGASGLELLKEVEPGIPLGKLAGEYELFAITKAGAFGNDQSLVNAVLNLKGEKE
ncbi:four-carbon acid sugar kinase family protein [Neobacillus sp. CF12]|uniref:four-carbon acid sugar kinase family protein n=1 Tax=Neobacillus sp. CF12 TaxID=3055864 RepID=UPI0025A23071|nr:four-carbon acid sugar kinase family protein [Neobacillus sp. CF12]MDM5329565.1 four-carbon acid sugar kinase family protein [Neobacillus sp. CF12]